MSSKFVSQIFFVALLIMYLLPEPYSLASSRSLNSQVYQAKVNDFLRFASSKEDVEIKMKKTKVSLSGILPNETKEGRIQIGAVNGDFYTKFTDNFWQKIGVAISLQYFFWQRMGVEFGITEVTKNVGEDKLLTTTVYLGVLYNILELNFFALGKLKLIGDLGYLYQSASGRSSIDTTYAGLLVNYYLYPNLYTYWDTRTSVQEFDGQRKQAIGSQIGIGTVF